MQKALLAGILALGMAGSAAAQQSGPYVRESVRTLPNNTRIVATIQEPISSNSNRIGDIIAATITNDVKDANGNVVFPAGSSAKVRIIDIKGGDKNAKNGALALQVQSVVASGQTFTLTTSTNSGAGDSQKPGWTSDKKKIGIGAAAGAIVGGLASGSLKGALAGGVLGAAGGAVVAHEMNGREVVMKTGTNVDFVITESMQVLVS